MVNLGTILVTASLLSPQGYHENPVVPGAGGTIINGAATLTSALIQGYERGIYAGGGSSHPLSGAVTTVINYGTIAGTGTGTVSTATGHQPGGGRGRHQSRADLGCRQKRHRHRHHLKVRQRRHASPLGTVTFTGTGTSGEAVYLGAGGTVTNYGLDQRGPYRQPGKWHHRRVLRRRRHSEATSDGRQFWNDHQPQQQQRRKPA